MKQLAFGSLLLATSQLVAPAALAQTAQAGATQTQTPQDQTQPPAEEQVEVSTPGAEAGDTGEIVVTGRNIPNIVRATPQVISVLSAGDIARTGEGDIAGALQRVTGLSVVGNGYVYVRGLGDRYSASMLNGSPLPSPEPLKRVVPLDIFPTNVIASALVQKSYSANYPAEFGGGVINLTTKAVPDKWFVQAEFGIGFDTVTSSELGYVHDGGESDFFGYDSGTRSVPQFITDAGVNGTALLPSSEIINLTNAETTLVQANWHIPPNLQWEASFGGSTDIGNVRLGLIAAGGFSNKWNTRDAIQQFAQDDQGGLSKDFRIVTTDNRVIVNGLGGIGAEFGEHKIRLTQLYIHDTVKQTSLGEGGAGNNFNVIDGHKAFIDQTTAWYERQLLDTQAVGEFRFGDLSLDLRGTYANTKRKAPYERDFRYEYVTNLSFLPVNDYVNNFGTNTPATITFSDLNEDLWSGQADLAYKLRGAIPMTLSAGYFYSDADRTSSRYSFRYTGPGGSSLPTELSMIISQLRPDYLVSDDTILNSCKRWIPGFTGTNCIQLQQTSGDAPAYQAELTIHGGYAQVEAEVTTGLRANLGVRYETAKESVDTFSTHVPGTNLDNDYWLPAATLTWNFAQDMQLRLHGSKTIARPQFRELAPQVYQDYETTRTFTGNPLLVDSQLWNFETRYEWFFARDQKFTAAAFYKSIDNPIETIGFFPGGAQELTVGFSNAPRATLWGAEFEVQKYFPAHFLGDTRRFLVIGNYTYTDSKLHVGDELVPSPIQPNANPYQPANLLFVDGAPLVGQSKHLANLQLGIEDTDHLSQLTLLLNYASKRVVIRGPVGTGGGAPLPDIYEYPGCRLDLVARQGITFGRAEFELKFEGRNLTGTRHQEYQTFENGTRRDLNTYEMGRVFTVSISAKY